MKKSIIFATLFLTIFSFADTHTIYVDQKGTDNSDGTFTKPVATIAKALKLAKIVNPKEEMPVLIKLGQGEFVAPEENWTIDFQWIFFAGNGRENTKIIANKISLIPQTPSETKSLPSKRDLEGCFPITGFKDIYIDSLFDISDNFVPVDNVKILQLEKTEGQLEGIWYNAIGELQSTFPKGSEGNFNVTQISDLTANENSTANNIIMAIPDEDATNTFVLKNGDTMTGPLKIERYFPAEKFSMAPYAGSTNIVADLRLESNDGIS